MTADRSPTRRRVLRTAGATLVAAAAGCSNPPWATDETPDVTAAPVPTTATPTAPAATSAVTVVELVDFAFEPGTVEPLVVPTGTTVQFVWVTQAHNIRVDGRPTGSSWTGHEPIEETGFVHEHRFDVPGRYEFHCDPHQSLGMVGTTVVE